MPPNESNSSMNFTIGTKIYVPDPQQVWRRGEVVEIKKEGVSVRLDAEDKNVEIYELKNNGSFYLCNTDVWSSNGLYIPEDLTQLTHLHEASVLDSLNLRFDVDCIYTFTGPILIAVNPFKTIPGLYDSEKLIEYIKCASFTSTGGPPASSISSDDLQNSSSFSHSSTNSSAISSCAVAPHVFATSNAAYLGLCNSQKSQTILISGESGAGKTESTKYVMKFLACAGAEDINNRSQVEKQALESNPLLEAFGNARTLRNDNSSRFGKFIEMQFLLKKNRNIRNPYSSAAMTASLTDGKENEDKKKKQGKDGDSDSAYHLNPNLTHVGRLCGARIQTYLLEKVRVCDQQEGERNYHIFYQVCAAASAAQECSEEPGVYNFPLTRKYKDREDVCAQKLDLRLFEPYYNYRYLTKSSCFKLEGLDDVEEFESTIYAMQTVGIPLAEQMDIIRVVGGVLFLGNILFETPNSNSEGSEISDLCNEHVNRCVDLLGFPNEESLRNALCYRTIKTIHESYKKPLKVSEAEESRDALARALYGCMFLKVVQRTNQSIGYRDDVKLFCGVLDIFGFECFKYNSFEQLCINYTNERLQQFFNNFVFKCEEALYFREKIEWDPLDFPDNQDCVNLLQDKPFGIFAMLDEECQVPAGKDRGFNSKICQKHSYHKRFELIKTKPNCFIVRHFAGSVEYCSDGFLDKNKDQLSNDIQSLVLSSNCPFVVNLFSEFLNRGVTEGGPAATSATTSAASPVATSSSNASSKKRKYLTVSSEFREQLSLLINTINVTEPHFVRCIKPNPQNLPDIFERVTVNEQLRYGGVLQAVQVSRAGYPVRLSHKECFDDYLCIVEQRKSKEEEDFLNILLRDKNMDNFNYKEKVKCLLDFLDKKLSIPKPKYSSCSWAVGQTLCFFKNEAFEALQVNRSRVRNAAAVKIQAIFKCYAQRNSYLFLKKNAIFLQSHIRVFLARKLAQKLREEKAGHKILNFLKAYKCRCQYLRTRRNIIAIQRVYRGYVARKYVKEYKIFLAASKIQAHWRGHKQRTYFQKLKYATTKAQLAWKGILARRQLRALRAEAKEVTNLLAKSQNLIQELNAEKQKNKEFELHLIQSNAKYDELFKKYEHTCRDYENSKITIEELRAANAQYEELKHALSTRIKSTENVSVGRMDSLGGAHPPAHAVSAAAHPNERQTKKEAAEAKKKEKSESIDITKLVDDARREDLEKIQAFEKEVDSLQQKIQKLQNELQQEKSLREETEAKYNYVLDDAANKLASPSSLSVSTSMGVCGISNENEKIKRKPKQTRWINLLLTGPSKVGKTSLLEGLIKHMADEVHLNEMKKIRALEKGGTFSLRRFELMYGESVLRVVDCPYVKDSSNIMNDMFVHMKQAEHVVVVFDPSLQSSLDEAINIMKQARIQADANSGGQYVILLANTYKLQTKQANVQVDLKYARDAAASNRAVYREKCLLLELVSELFGPPPVAKMARREGVAPGQNANRQGVVAGGAGRGDGYGMANVPSTPTGGHAPSGPLQNMPSSNFNQNAGLTPSSSLTSYSQKWGLSSVMDTMKTWFNTSQNKKRSAPLQLLRPSIRGVPPATRSVNRGVGITPDDSTDLRPVQELQDIDSAVTCITFGQEKTTKPYILLAAAYKDGNVVVYRCYRTDIETRLMREETNNYYNFNNNMDNNFMGDDVNNVASNNDESNDNPDASTGGGATDSSSNHPNVAVHSRLLGHSKAVTSMFFTILEDQMVTTSIDKSVRFWSVETGDMLKVFTDSCPTLVAAFLPFNPTVFIASNSNSVLRLVNIQNGTVLQKLKVTSEVRALRFDDTGLFCFAGTRKGEVHVLETSDASNIRFRFKAQLSKAAITCITFVASTSPDTAPFLVMNSCDSHVTIVDCIYGDHKGGLSNLIIRARLPITHSLLPLRCCYSHHGGGWCVSASEDKDVYIYSLAERGCYKLSTLKYHRFPVLAVAMSSQDTLLVSADSSGKMVLWRRFDYSDYYYNTRGGNAANNNSSNNANNSVNNNSNNNNACNNINA